MNRKLDLFSIVNAVFLTVVAITCLIPFVYMLAVSFSSNTAASAGEVTLWPIGFNVQSYLFILNSKEFVRSFFVSIERVLLGVSVNMLLTILMAYPLSKESSAFRSRPYYAWYLFITMIFSGGLIPTFMVVKEMGLMDTVWAMVIPSAVPAFNVLLLMNFFRQLPKELEEACIMDGANHWVILWRVFVPITMPALATVGLFSIVYHWNSWFDGMIYMKHPSNYPLQTYLRSVIIMPDLTGLSPDMWKLLQEISNRTVKAAQIFISALPVIIVYPFLQKYFVKGIVLGSVKG